MQQNSFFCCLVYVHLHGRPEFQLYLWKKQCQSQVQNSCFTFLTILNATQWISHMSLNFLPFFITIIISRRKSKPRNKNKSTPLFSINLPSAYTKVFLNCTDYMEDWGFWLMFNEKISYCAVKCPTPTASPAIGWKQPQLPQTTRKGWGLVPQLLEHGGSVQSHEQLSQGLRPWLERAVVSLFLPVCWLRWWRQLLAWEKWNNLGGKITLNPSWKFYQRLWK